MKKRVFVSRRLPGSALDELAQHVDMTCWGGAEPPTAEQLLESTKQVDGLLCMLTDSIDEAFIDARPNLKVISSCSVGVDHVDVAALTQRGIPLGHTPHVLTDATADIAFALLLSAARRLPEGDSFMRENLWTPARRWEPDLLLGKDLNGATLGLIGLGAIGQAVARRAQGFGMRVIGWTPSARPVPGVESLTFDTVLQQSDFVSLHLALSASSKHIINESALKKMRADAILINTARGPLIDEAALIQALEQQSIGGAALDVFEEEPILGDHPLMKFPNCVVVPHIGSATLGTRSKMAQLSVDNLLAALNDQPMPHCVNPEVQMSSRE